MKKNDLRNFVRDDKEKHKTRDVIFSILFMCLSAILISLLIYLTERIL